MGVKCQYHKFAWEVYINNKLEFVSTQFFDCLVYLTSIKCLKGE